MVPIFFELMAVMAALGFGFMLGRIWEIRREIRRDQFRRDYVASPWRREIALTNGVPAPSSRAQAASQLSGCLPH
jgi:hypothetical protein